ncbi:MAG: caspase family protein [Pseudomonadota bacterium]
MRKFAFLVGINDYGPESNLKGLSFAEDDAVRMGRALEGLGFQVDVLTGDAASRRAIEEYLTGQVLDEGLSKEDLFLFFFSGHGQTIRGDHYLHFHGAQHGLLPGSYQVYNLFDLILKVIPCRHIVGILDACRDDARGVWKGGAPRGASAHTKNIQMVVDRAEVHYQRYPRILFACGDDEVSWEDPELKHGVLTWFLLDEFEGWQGDRALVFEDLCEVVASRVSDHAEGTLGSRQNPELKRKLGKGRLCLAGEHLAAPRPGETGAPDISAFKATVRGLLEPVMRITRGEMPSDQMELLVRLGVDRGLSEDRARQAVEAQAKLLRLRFVDLPAPETSEEVPRIGVGDADGGGDFFIDPSGGVSVRLPSRGAIQILPITGYQLSRLRGTHPELFSGAQSLHLGASTERPTHMASARIRDLVLRNASFEEGRAIAVALGGRLPTLDEWKEAREIWFQRPDFFAKARDFLTTRPKRGSLILNYRLLLDVLVSRGVKRSDLCASLDDLASRYPDQPPGPLYTCNLITGEFPRVTGKERRSERFAVSVFWPEDDGMVGYAGRGER